MRIDGLELKNFGKMKNQRFSFSEGINVIYGPNESGKTTVYMGILGLLFGLEKSRGKAARTDAYTTYQPWENPSFYEGSLTFTTGERHFLLERRFYHPDRSARLVCVTDGEELSVEQGDLETLLGDLSKTLFCNTAAAGQLKMKPEEIVYSYLKNFTVSLWEESGQATDVMKALELLEKKKKVYEQRKKKERLALEEKLHTVEIRQEMTEKELEKGQRQLRQMQELLKEKQGVLKEKRPRGLFARIKAWIRRLLFGKRIRREEKECQEERRGYEEKAAFLKEFLGEKESFLAELLSEKEVVYEKLHEQSRDEEGKALELAMERIRELSAHREEEVLRQLLDKASDALCQITKGKYEKLLFQDGEEPVVWDGSRMVKLFQLSGGSVDQVYLALRIGLSGLFFREEAMPLLFDDSFVYFDEQRLERLLGYLGELHRQVFLFTCHKREMRLLEKLGIPYRKILL